MEMGTGKTKGNTPAYAGKTPQDLGDVICIQKHPRVCGEDLFPATMKGMPAETPPRMRGRP